MLEWIQNLLNSLGYVGITFLMFLENVFPPIPSEVIMPLSGFTATQGQLNLIGVIIAGTIGSVLGGLPLYYLGKIVGHERLIKLADRYGKWLTVSGKDIDKAEDWFDRHGHKAVLFGRLVPGVRSLIAIPAGISDMPMPKFLLYSAIGSGLWTALLGYLGYVLGENYELVERYVGPLAYVVVGVIVIAAIVWIVRRKRRQQTG